MNNKNAVQTRLKGHQTSCSIPVPGGSEVGAGDLNNSGTIFLWVPGKRKFNIIGSVNTM